MFIVNPGDELLKKKVSHIYHLKINLKGERTISSSRLKAEFDSKSPYIAHCQYASRRNYMMGRKLFAWEKR